MKKNSIEIQNLYKSYQQLTVFNGFNFYHTDKSLVIGRNGSGKTSLFNILCSLETFDSVESYHNKATISWNGQLSANQYLKKLSLSDNIKFNKIAFLQSNLELGSIEGLLQNKSILSINDLSSAYKKIYHIYNTFLKKADLYILDEPLQNLDDQNVKHIINFFEKVNTSIILFIQPQQEKLFQSGAFKKCYI